ncbi:Uncharacterized protein APZ42_024185 [Daphnia magna]|uniref:Uncharacterized protein n=1 Tax=Daphnia magna TaxID=35525 RepID=A0A0P6EZ39_9CRUS|nr:Uncharacterized protein APZ42_024185 [Daphnia magna]
MLHISYVMVVANRGRQRARNKHKVFTTKNVTHVRQAWQQHTRLPIHVRFAIRLLWNSPFGAC